MIPFVVFIIISYYTFNSIITYQHTGFQASMKYNYFAFTVSPIS